MKWPILRIHDRYLIIDFIGRIRQNGFDTIRAGNARTTWGRMLRKERDDVQREFRSRARSPRSSG